MTAVGFTTAQESDCRVHDGHCERVAEAIVGCVGRFSQQRRENSSEDPADSELQSFQQRKADMREEIESLDRQIDQLKQSRKDTPHHIPIKSLPEEDRFTRLRTERKHFVDTIKMIAYRAESTMASLLREHIARPDDARALLRQIFETEADLTPDLSDVAKTTSQIGHESVVPLRQYLIGFKGK
jgi:hypothetical protein